MFMQGFMAAESEMRAGEKITLENGQLTGPSTAEQYLGRKYREGWTL